MMSFVGDIIMNNHCNDYIDREALLAHMKDVPTWKPEPDPTSDRHMETHYPDGDYFPEDVISSIENAPAADVAPVVHAHWIDMQYESGMAECSVCGETYDCTEEMFDAFAMFYHYCPNCGAKMDEAESNG